MRNIFKEENGKSIGFWNILLFVVITLLFMSLPTAGGIALFLLATSVIEKILCLLVIIGGDAAFIYLFYFHEEPFNY